MGLFAPSRKKYDYFTPRTGEYVQLERRRSTAYGGGLTGAGSVTLYTVPTGRRAKLTYFSHGATANYSYLQIMPAGTLLSDAATGNHEYNAKYEDGIDLNDGDYIIISNSLGMAGAATATLVIIEEEASNGYFVSSAWNF